MSSIVKIDSQSFKDEVLQAEQPVLVDFTAVWCGPCKMLEPIIEQLAVEWQGKARVVRVDVDESPDIAMHYQIMGVPTLMLFKRGEPVERATGYQPKERLIHKFLSHL